MCIPTINHRRAVTGGRVRPYSPFGHGEAQDAAQISRFDVCESTFSVYSQSQLQAPLASRLGPSRPKKSAAPCGLRQIAPALGHTEPSSLVATVPFYEHITPSYRAYKGHHGKSAVQLRSAHIRAPQNRSELKNNPKINQGDI